MLIGISGKINSGKDLVGQIIQYLTEGIDKANIPFDKWDGQTLWGAKQFDWKVVKFADKLKDIVCLLIGCTREQLEDREFKEKELGEEWWYVQQFNKVLSHQEYLNYIQGTSYLYKESDIIKPTPRMLLQQIGTELFRNLVHPNTWVNATMVSYRPFIEGHPNLIKSNGKVLIEGQVYFMGKAVYPNWIITDCRFPNEADAVKSRGGINIRVNRPKEVNTDELHIEHSSETALDDYKFDYVIDNTGTVEELINKVREILIKEKIING